MLTDADPPLERVVVPTSYGATHLLRSTGPPGGHEILCLHGWGLCSTLWVASGAVGTLSSAGRATVVDLPGHPGPSERVALPASSAGVGAWIAEVMDGLGVRSASLVGSSLGGALVLRASLAIPERTERVVALAPAGLVRPWPGPRLLLGLLPYLLHPTRSSTRRFVERCLLGSGHESGHDTAEGVREALVGYLHRTASAAPVRSPIPRLLPSSALRRLDRPTLVLLGADDVVFSPGRSAGRLTRHAPPCVSVRTLEGRGHLVELSRDAVERASAFLAR